MSAGDAALKRWAHAREQTIDLPSGSGRATVRLLTIPEAVALGRIPNPLVGIAIKAESGELDRELTPEEVAEWHDLQSVVVASQVLRFSPSRGNGIKGPLDVEWVKWEMPPQDRERLFAAITHIIPQSLFRGIVAASLGEGASFRGRSRRAPVPAGGGDDGEAA